MTHTHTYTVTYVWEVREERDIKGGEHAGSTAVMIALYDNEEAAKDHMDAQMRRGASRVDMNRRTVYSTYGNWRAQERTR